MIVLFDGVCNLCNRSVDFIIRHDRSGTIRFAAQQSETGQRLLAEHGLAAAGGQTMVVITDGGVYTQSTAALRIARRLGWPWSLWYGLIVVPRILRDPVYRCIARHRYRWFGRRDTCRVPTEAERARFL